MQTKNTIHQMSRMSKAQENLFPLHRHKLILLIELEKKSSTAKLTTLRSLKGSSYAVYHSVSFISSFTVPQSSKKGVQISGKAMATILSFKNSVLYLHFVLIMDYVSVRGNEFIRMS